MVSRMTSLVARSPRLQAEYERMARERLEAERDSARVRLLEFFRVSLECIGSCALGMLGIAIALHSTDHEIGMIFWWGGLVAGYSGMCVSLLAGYLRAEKRGVW